MMDNDQPPFVASPGMLRQLKVGSVSADITRAYLCSAAAQIEDLERRLEEALEATPNRETEEAR